MTYASFAVNYLYSKLNNVFDVNVSRDKPFVSKKSHPPLGSTKILVLLIRKMERMRRPYNRYRILHLLEYKLLRRDIKGKIKMTHSSYNGIVETRLTRNPQSCGS